jgi:radical SAM superfamily enzyme YgiQ (UPF0313 family)
MSKPKEVQKEGDLKSSMQGRRRALRLFLARVGRRTAELPIITPPLGILSLAAYLRDQLALEVRIHDQHLHNSTSDELVRGAVEMGAEVVGLGLLTSGSHLLPELTRKIRQALPKALVVLGGPHVSAFQSGAMAGVDADAAVPGEGELSLEQILLAHLNRSGFADIPGLIWRDSSGEIVTNPGVSPQVEDLDSLPFLAYDLIDPRAYWRFESMANVPPRPYIGMFSSRGCPYHCIYCHSIFGKCFRAQSPERVIAEIEHYQRTYGVREVEFYDDTFNHNARRVVDFCQSALRRNLRMKIAFPNAIRGDILTSETIDALVDAGLYYTACALESGTPRIQKYIGKNLNIPRFLEGVEKLARRHVFTYGFTMLGFPTETEEDLQRTIDVASGSSLHIASFFTVTPFPGTELYRRVLQDYPERLKGIDYADMSYPSLMFNLSEVPDAVFFSYKAKALRTFYFNPKRVARIAMDFPNPLYLPHYIPVLGRQLLKGLRPSHA